MRISSLSTFVVALTACYDLPKPDCGFVCGPSAACPADYTCNMADNRCHLDATSVACAPGFDAGTDAGDRIAPEVLFFTPAPDAEDVLLGARITVMFSERVVGASPVTILLERAGEQVPTGVVFDLASNTATVTPVAPLAPATTYAGTVTDDLIDLAGNPLGGPITWQFTTSTPPLVIGRSPGINANAVAVNAVVVADFNEQIFGVTSVSFTLMSAVGLVTGVRSVTNLNSRVTFTPASQLAADTAYTVILSTAIIDGVGNSLVGAPVNWTFMTGADTVGPMIVTKSPEVDRMDVLVETSVIVQFDEPVIVDTASFTLTPVGGTPVVATITSSSGGRTARLRPDLDLIPNTTYTATLSAAITDSSSNALTGAPVTWSFTTGPP